MPEHKFVTVVCKVCDTRIDEEASEHARESFCPVCQSLIIVPAASAAVLKAPLFKTDPNLEGYAVLPLDGPEAEARAKKAQDVILVNCPVCRARLHAPPKKESYHIKCHDCHELVRVPSRAEHRARQKREAIPEKREVIEPVPVGRAVESDRFYSSWYLQAHSEIRREPDARPPKNLYFWSTFTFPWEPGIAARWFYLTLGLTFLAMAAVLTMSLLSGGERIAGFASAFFALPLVWVAIWTVSYAASVGMAIITDTANGNQKIVNWADQNWRDWVITMAYVLYLIAVASLAGYVINKVLQFAGVETSLPGIIVSAMAVPYVILSALETGGGLNFISANVTLSVFSKPLPWLGYYILSAAFTASVAGALWGLLRFSPLLAAGLGGMILAAWVIIEARLTGRLAWAISRE
ncbi:MAG TPA: hypothetical protein VM510_04595 [Caulifigura sp.]|nr:hypothetical protein [Caulifigura sp.]